MKIRNILLAALAALACASVLEPASAQHVSSPDAFQIERGVVQHPTQLGVSTDPADDLAAVRDRIVREHAELTQLSGATDGQVQVPYGSWLAALMQALLVFAAGVVTWIMARVSPNIKSALDMLARFWGQENANQLLEKAIGYGINTTSDAVRGQVLTVKVGNEVLERAFEYAIRHAPELVTKLGGIEMIREKIIARLNLEASAAIPAPRPPAQQLIAATPAKVTTPAAAT